MQGRTPKQGKPPQCREGPLSAGKAHWEIWYTGLDMTTPAQALEGNALLC